LGKTVVSIVKVDEVSDAVEKAVELAGGLDVNEGDVVVIKPNAKNPSAPGYGIVTDPRVVEAVVRLSLQRGARKVKIAEGAAYPSGAYNTFAAFEAIGITEIAKRWDVELVDLNSYDSIDVDVTSGFDVPGGRLGPSPSNATIPSTR